MPKRSADLEKTPAKKGRTVSSTSSSSDEETQTQPIKSVTKRNNPLWDHFTLKDDWVLEKTATKREQYPPAICNHCKAVVTRLDGNTSHMLT